MGAVIKIITIKVYDDNNEAIRAKGLGEGKATVSGLHCHTLTFTGLSRPHCVCHLASFHSI
jgi:hypothetical protein